jgi:hypothetical protein
VRKLILALCLFGIAGVLFYRQVDEEKASVAATTSRPTPTAVGNDGAPTSSSPRAAVNAPASYPSAAAPELRPLTPIPQTHEKVMALKFVAPETVHVGERFSVSVVADAHAPISRYELKLAFDPAKLASISASPGDFMEQGSALAKFSENAASSRGDLVIGVEQDGGAGVEGTGSVVVIEFQASSPGVARIAFKSGEAFRGNGNAVPIKAPSPQLVTVAN